NVDGLGAKPLRSAPGADIPAASLIQGTPYVATYFNAMGEWILQGAYGGLGIPVGCGMDYWGATAPSSNFALAYGQAISRTTYAACFAVMGTTFGAGDGATTFNLPDKRGRVSAGKDDMGGAAASRLTTSYFGSNASTLGAASGFESNTLSTTTMPAH